jgi:hypothetical protein
MDSHETNGNPIRMGTIGEYFMGTGWRFMRMGINVLAMGNGYARKV